MKKQKQNPQDQELQDEQLEKAAGGNTPNQLWGDWFFIDPANTTPDTGSLTTKEGADDRSEDTR